jgi:hypothetical protein
MRVATDRLELNGAWFDLVCVRRSGVAVFRGDGTYLRLGAAISAELEVHRRMLELGCPVPAILEVGQHGGTPYLLEESLGDHTLGDRCAGRGGRGQMTPEEYAVLRDVLLRHARGQLREQRTWAGDELAAFLGAAHARTNLPDLAARIDVALGLATASLSRLPATLQHGDLHPYNVCPLGIIDLEGSGWGPAGYDVTTAVLEPSLAEATWDHGSLVLAWFTREQVTAYLDALDEVFTQASLTPPSTLLDAYLVCAVIAMCSGTPRDPAVRDRRRNVLQRSLASYLEEGRFPIELGHSA